ncbi:MAG: biotin--[acetyl-CoA-carboxylase] ligase [Isosphaera sp.]|nr:biotin--[acetyl-CoA-carboxylase] ligase [Isosphaera sp.]
MTPLPRAEWRLDTHRVGRRVLFFDSLDSTNTTAAALAEDGLAVVADFQTAGRGQYGRVWQARPGGSLLMSVVLRPPPELCRPVVLTALAAVAVADAVYALTGCQARVKWPNDVLVRGKKVCGILIESAAVAVVGIGLNLNQTADEFAAAGLPGAASLRVFSGAETDPADAAAVVLRKLNAEYERLLGGEQVGVEADWKWRVGLLGRPVVAELADGTAVAGRLREMTFDGLELDAPDGMRVLVPETVRHLRPSEPDA